MTEGESLSEQSLRWSAAHDGTSLRAIRDQRAALAARARDDPPDVAAALALGRLLDLEGAAADVVAALDHARPDARGADRERIELNLAQADFERGHLAEAQDRLERALGGSDPETVVTAALALVRLRLVRAPESAGEYLADAKKRYADTGQTWPWIDASLAAAEAGVALRDGRTGEAQTYLQRALDLALGYGGELEAALAAGLLGNLDLDLGHDEAAEAWFAEAVRLSHRAGATTVEAIYHGYRGWALQRSKQIDRAQTLYEEAITMAEAIGMTRFSSQFEALLTTVGLTEANLEPQEIVFRRALAELRGTGDSERADALAVLEVVFEVGRARRAPTEIEAHRRLIVAHGRLHRSPSTTDDGRIAHRQAREAFDAALADLARASADLCVMPGGKGGIGPVGGFSLQQHPTLQRLLWALVEAWSEGRSVSDDELIAATWPGQRLVPGAATRRLQVGISSLRKVALGALLRRVEDGYDLVASSVALIPEGQLSPIE